MKTPGTGKGLKELKFVPKTEVSAYPLYENAPREDAKGTFICIWMRMRHFGGLKRADYLVYGAIKATTNSAMANDDTSLITAAQIAIRIGCSEPKVYNVLKHLRELGIIERTTNSNGIRVLRILRDFSKVQPEETGTLGTPSLKYTPPDKGNAPKAFFKVFDKLINFTELDEVDRLVYSIIHYYCTYHRKPISFSDEALGASIDVCGKSVQKSIKKMESLEILCVENLGKSSGRERRRISLNRDFEKLQEEEIKYLTEHGKTPTPLPPPKTNEVFGFNHEGILIALNEDKARKIFADIMNATPYLGDSRETNIKGGAKNMEEYVDILDDNVHHLLRALAVLNNPEIRTHAEEHLKKYRAEREKCEEALVELYKKGEVETHSTALPPHSTPES